MPREPSHFWLLSIYARLCGRKYDWNAIKPTFGQMTSHPCLTSTAMHGHMTSSSSGLVPRPLLFSTLHAEKLRAMLKNRSGLGMRLGTRSGFEHRQINGRLDWKPKISRALLQNSARYSARRQLSAAAERMGKSSAVLQSLTRPLPPQRWIWHHQNQNVLTMQRCGGSSLGSSQPLLLR